MYGLVWFGPKVTAQLFAPRVDLTRLGTMRYMLTPEQSERYGSLVEAITAQAASADAAAKTIAEAVMARKPRSRYTIGREATLLPLLTALPDRMLDCILAAALRPHFPRRPIERGDAATACR